MGDKTIIREADTDRIRALLVDCPGGVRAADIARTLRMGTDRVKAHLAAGRKSGLFIFGCAAWYSCAHTRVVVEKQAAALQFELERRRVRSRAWHAARRVKVEAAAVLPVKQVVGRTWTSSLVAPGPSSVFALGDRVLSSC